MAQSKDKLKLLTLNTHSWQETDSVSCLRHVADALMHEKPDIIALQEVNQKQNAPVVSESILNANRFISAGHQIHMDNWALALSEIVPDYQWCWCFTHIGYRIWEEGLAILSRQPILEVRCQDLSTAESKLRRYALAVRTRFGWFISTHLGWWDDPNDPFAGQWDRLNTFAQCLENPVYLMGDFNSPAHEHGKGYDRILADGWKDCYTRAETRDAGITVPGQIDGWRDAAVSGFRMDFCLAGQAGRTLSSRVIFNGAFYPVASDHFGVLTEEQLPFFNA